MSNVAFTPRKRGRPREFDLDAATASLLAALWRRGFQAPNVEELATETGLSVSSLYAAFGSKQGMLQAALRRYDHEMDSLLTDLESAKRGLPDIQRFIRRVRAATSTPNSPPGCFVVNTMVELGDSVPAVQQLVASYRRRVELALRGALDTAEEYGDIESGSSQDRARLIQAALFGAFAAARAGQTAAARDGLLAISRELGRWTSAVHPDRG